ncbi:arsenic metallochaperone ArsD family protein [Peribacillus sp. TH16]|nr:arsenic metallochaperone ArsD family protein [Peribacillus sp. TH16]
MMKVENFDPSMCCSTGVCRPSIDPELTRVASAVYSFIHYYNHQRIKGKLKGMSPVDYRVHAFEAA